MCGIAGVFFQDSRSPAVDFANIITNSQTHRGPDGSKIWKHLSKNIAIGHNRLAIIEPSPVGAQPWISDSSDLILSWNGEIYNYLDIRSELESNGVKFKTKTDTEVLSRGYEFFGVDVFKKLRGMFAIIIYDLNKDQIIIARDRLGIKPLYYAFFNGGIMFASETKSLRKVDSSLSHINYKMVNRFLDKGSIIFENETFYKNLYSVLPGNYAVIEEFSAKINFYEYWNILDSTNEKRSLNPDLLRQEVTTAINLHLRSDVPVCAALSGGLDSSIVTSVTNSFTKDINKALMTFSVTWPSNPEIDESVWVNEITDFFAIDNTRVTISNSEVADLINETLMVQDEPFASTSVIAQYVLYREIGSKNYKVVLDGQGSDELFLGYQWLLPYFFRDLFYSLNILRFIGNLFYIINDKEKTGLSFESLKLIFLTVISPKRLLKKLNHKMDLDSLEILRLNLLVGGNLQSLLKYQDRNSMAWAVESRVPFLDHILVEKVLLTDPGLSFSKGTLKNQLRLAFTDFLPKKTIDRKSKFGFTTPEQYWMQSIVKLDETKSKVSSKQWREFIVSKWIEMLNNEI